MKIYHTETQADYDALMVELESKGIETLKEHYWKEYDNQTVVFVRAIGRYHNSNRTDMSYENLGWAFKNYPDIPIIKYKAKADEKMRFTKENVEAVINEYFRQAGFESCGDLIAEIRNLDATPEKIVVPKFVADWIELCKEKANLVDCLQGGYRHFNGCEHIGEDKDWLFEGDNQDVVARAWLDGYEVEEEPLYCVNINGQYLVKISADCNEHEFEVEAGLWVWAPQAYQLTESEIKAIDERYCAFAVPVQEVKNEL